MNPSNGFVETLQQCTGKFELIIRPFIDGLLELQIRTAEGVICRMQIIQEKFLPIMGHLGGALDNASLRIKFAQNSMIIEGLSQ